MKEVKVVNQHLPSSNAARLAMRNVKTPIPACDDKVPPDPLDSFHPCLTRGPVRRRNETEASYKQRCFKDLNGLAEACQCHTHKAT